LQRRAIRGMKIESHMPVAFKPTPLERALAWAPFVASAALIATLIDFALRRRGLALGLAEIAVLFSIPQLLRRRRLRRVLRSGNVDAVLSAWQSSVERVPHPETMAPLITATALAAHGLSERAHRALSLAHKGPAWEAALEQRLVLDTLLSVFDGEPERAIASSSALERLPLPPSPFLRGRVSGLRDAMAAFARAFAHQSALGDLSTLKAAARANPLVHWAMRYAAAVASIDHGDSAGAVRLLDGAPSWPEESAFASFHQEIAEAASLR
jgi:hypothetical protein